MANVQVSQWPTCFYHIPLEAGAFAFNAELASTIRKYSSGERVANMCYRHQNYKTRQNRHRACKKRLKCHRS
jgi:hypothetical protein